MFQHVDAYAGDPILYTVTAADVDARGDLLCDGQKALLRAYPDTWRLNVYPTRRSASVRATTPDGPPTRLVSNRPGSNSLASGVRRRPITRGSRVTTRAPQ